MLAASRLDDFWRVLAIRHTGSSVAIMRATLRLFLLRTGFEYLPFTVCGEERQQRIQQVAYNDQNID